MMNNKRLEATSRLLCHEMGMHGNGVMPLKVFLIHHPLAFCTMPSPWISEMLVHRGSLREKRQTRLASKASSDPKVSPHPL